MTSRDGNQLQPRYYAMMLHIDDQDLDPFEYRLLGHIRRRAGGRGICYAGVSSMAKQTRMSERKVREVLEDLEVRHRRISIEAQPGRPYKITPLNLFEENEQRMSSATPGENDTPGENARGAGTTDPLRKRHHTPGVSATTPLAKAPYTPGANARRRRTHQEEPVKEKQQEEEIQDFLATGGIGRARSADGVMPPPAEVDRYLAEMDSEFVKGFPAGAVQRLCVFVGINARTAAKAAQRPKLSPDIFLHHYRDVYADASLKNRRGVLVHRLQLSE